MRNERLVQLLGALAAVLVVLIGYFLLVSPKMDESDTALRAADGVNQTNAKLQGTLDKVRKDNANLNQLVDDLKALRLRLPVKDDMTTFIDTLYSIGASTGVQVGPVSQARPSAVSASTAGAASSGIYSIAINATVVGASTALELYLHQVQAVQPRAAYVSSAALTATGGHSVADLATMQMTLTVFIAPATAPNTGKTG